MTIDVAFRHVTKGRWEHGYPAELYWADSLPCIRYQDGMSFHYDVIKGTWF